mmetsp:Transcript_37182/g.107109  ORF Transcript_37182/g.107109 Transcript_37182/m.107109 type:complete len:319 (+) Transcript_37182:949-1905(+)
MGCPRVEVPPRRHGRGVLVATVDLEAEGTPEEAHLRNTGAGFGAQRQHQRSQPVALQKVQCRGEVQGVLSSSVKEECLGLNIVICAALPGGPGIAREAQAGRTQAVGTSLRAVAKLLPPGQAPELPLEPRDGADHVLAEEAAFQSQVVLKLVEQNKVLDCGVGLPFFAQQAPIGCGAVGQGGLEGRLGHRGGHVCLQERVEGRLDSERQLVDAEEGCAEEAHDNGQGKDGQHAEGKLEGAVCKPLRSARTDGVPHYLLLNGLLPLLRANVLLPQLPLHRGLLLNLGRLSRAGHLHLQLLHQPLRPSCHSLRLHLHLWR